MIDLNKSLSFNTSSVLVHTPLDTLLHRTQIQHLAFHDYTPENTPKPNGLRTLLGLNLKFCPTPLHQVHTRNTLLNTLEDLKRSIRIRSMFYGRSNSKYIKKLHVPNKEFIPKVSSIPNIEPIFSEIEMNIKSLPLRRRQKQFNLTHHQYSIIKQLRANPNLIVINTDKNLGPALVTTSQYNNLCYEHLGHPNTYEVIINTDQNTMKAHLINLVQSFYNRIEYDLICSNQDTNHLKIIISDINNKDRKSVV